MPSRQHDAHTWIDTDRSASGHENTPTTRSDDLALLGYDEVASMLRISTRTLHRHVTSGAFPRPFRLGRKPVWLRDRVVEFLVEAQTDAEKGRKKRQC